VEFRVVRDALEQLALFATVFDCATKRHAALVFLLTTGFDGAAVFVLPGHVESPNASTGSSGWARRMTVWRRGGYRTMNIPKLKEIACRSWLPAMQAPQVFS